MDEVHEQMAWIETVASPKEKVSAFRSQLAELRARYPNQWVAYFDRWDETMGAFEFSVEGPFASRADVVAWLSDRPEYEEWTVFHAAVPQPGVYTVR